MNATMDQIDRRKFIGGSDIGAILGLSPWKTALDVWNDKVQPPKPADPARERFFTRGKRLEPIIVDMMRDELGLDIVERNRRYIDPEHAFMACEVDAETASGENVEIKTVHPFLAKKWGEEDTDQIPDVYTAQALHGLMVTGRRLCRFGVLIGADDLRTYLVERNDEAIALMRAREVQFWHLVETMTPPPPTTLGDVESMFPNDSGRTVEVTDQSVIDAIFHLRNIKDQLKDLDARKDAAELTIKQAMGDVTVLTIGGKKACSWKTQTANRVSVKALQEQMPDIAQRFTFPSSTRVFRIS